MTDPFAPPSANSGRPLRIWLEEKRRWVEQMHVGQLVMLEIACLGGLLLGLNLIVAFGLLPAFAGRGSASWSDGGGPATVPGTVLTEAELAHRLRATDRLTGLSSADSVELIRLSVIHVYDLTPELREQRARLLAERDREVETVSEVRRLVVVPSSALTPEDQARRGALLREIGPLDQLTVEEREARDLAADSPVFAVALYGISLIGLLGGGLAAYVGVGSLRTWLHASELRTVD